MKKYGFSKKERLLTPAQFKTVCRRGRRRKSNLCWAYFAANGFKHNRLGISVSKRVCANIVIRNRIKRLIREAYRLHKTSFGYGQDVVIVVKKCPQSTANNLVKNAVLSLVKNEKDCNFSH